MEALSVFGSVARGDNGPSSDVDILVDMPPHISKLHALKLFLEQRLHTSVDLVRNHSHMSSRFLNQISTDAVKIL
ncbi:MAG: nucleotidyltransferase domain-containing protein [Muribaculaceae bacterium]|nr:nucleotidyltransferase domain-containing protein [Muribaculaceae bacterium]